MGQYWWISRAQAPAAVSQWGLVASQLGPWVDQWTVGASGESVCPLLGHLSPQVSDLCPLVNNLRPYSESVGPSGNLLGHWGPVVSHWGTLACK